MLVCVVSLRAMDASCHNQLQAGTVLILMDLLASAPAWSSQCISQCTMDENTSMDSGLSPFDSAAPPLTLSSLPSMISMVPDSDSISTPESATEQLHLIMRQVAQLTSISSSSDAADPSSCPIIQYVYDWRVLAAWNKARCLESNQISECWMADYFIWSSAQLTDVKREQLLK